MAGLNAQFLCFGLAVDSTSPTLTFPFVKVEARNGMNNDNIQPESHDVGNKIG